MLFMLKKWQSNSIYQLGKKGPQTSGWLGLCMEIILPWSWSTLFHSEYEMAHYMGESRHKTYKSNLGFHWDGNWCFFRCWLAGPVGLRPTSSWNEVSNSNPFPGRSIDRPFICKCSKHFLLKEKYTQNDTNRHRKTKKTSHLSKQ